MPNKEDNQNIAEAEKAAQVQPETGVDKNQPAPQVEPETPQSEPETVAEDNELAKWKAMSRKNEKQAEANLKQMQQYQAELAQIKADNARLTASNKYPQVTAEVLADLCSETEPEKIAAWAERYAQRNPIAATSSQPSKPLGSSLERKVTRLAENPEGEFNPKPKQGDAYKRSQERQNARRRNRNKTK